MINFQEAIDLHRCLNFIENSSNQKINKETSIKCGDGIEILFMYNSEEEIIIIQAIINGKESPSLKNKLNEYFKEEQYEENY